MNHPFQESINKIDNKIELLIEKVTKTQSPLRDDMFIENEAFLELMHISSNTAANWRDQGLIAFSQVKNKIYYKVIDIKKLINDHYHPLKKK
jgi:hypothetical protein